MEFDSVIERLGDFGRWQVLHYVLIGLSGTANGMHCLANIFLVGLPSYWCKPPADLANETLRDQRRVSAPYVRTNGHYEYSACSVFDLDYGGPNVTRMLAANGTYNEEDFATKPCQSWQYDTDLFGNTIVSEWDLVCSNAWKRAMAQSVYMFGFLVGAIGFGSLSDRIGRKKSWAAALVLLVLSGVAAAFAPEYWSHIWLRFISGASGAGSFTCGFVLIMEIIGIEKRMVPGIFYQGWFGLGYMSEALIAYLIRDYFIFQIVISVIPLVWLTFYWFLGDSPRWLISQGRYEEAEKEVQRAARMNRVDYPADLMTPLPVSGTTPEVATEKHQKESYTVIDLLRTPNLRMISVNVFFNWFVNSLVYYGLAMTVTDLAGSPYVNVFISGLVEFPGYLFCVLTLNRLGRRIPLTILMLVGGVACLLTLVIPEELWILKTVLAMLGKLGISGSFALIYVFSAELFPTVVRTIGVGAGSMHARIGSLIAPFVAELGKLVWGPLPIIIFGVSSVAAGLLALLLPETLHQELPETLADGELFAKNRRPKFGLCWKRKAAEEKGGTKNVSQALINGNANITTKEASV